MFSVLTIIRVGYDAHSNQHLSLIEVVISQVYLEDLDYSSSLAVCIAKFQDLSQYFLVSVVPGNFLLFLLGETTYSEYLVCFEYSYRSRYSRTAVFYCAT